MNVETVYIEITNRCNFNCRTCYNRSGLNHETVEISTDGIKDIIALFSSYGAKRFLFSGGEPTLHSEFDRILDIIESRTDLSFGLVTNGSSRNPKLIDFLNRAQNVTLQISLDGSNEEENAKTRGAGHFGMVLRFVNMIKNPALKPLLKMVVSQSNLHDAENFYRLAVSLGCIPEFAFIYRSGNAQSGWEDKAVSPLNKLKLLKLIDNLNEEYGISAFLPFCTSTCPFTNSDSKMSVAIKSDGSIQPCQTLYSNEFSLGNAFSFNRSEFEANLQKLIALAKMRTSLDFGCVKCMLKEACGRGCMAEAFNITGNPLGDDGGCAFRKMQFIGYQIAKQQRTI